MSVAQMMYDLLLLDQKVRGIGSRLKAADQRLSDQRAKVDQCRQQHDEMVDQLMHTRVRTRALENQVAELNQRIARQREMMNTVKNNKEYSALLVEVNTFKHEKSKIEDETLEQMSLVESLEQEQVELDRRIEEQKKIVDVAAGEVEACAAEIGDQLEALTHQRDEAEKQLPPKMRETYHRLVKIHSEDAVATVAEENRRRMDYSCGGCYLSIPVETVSILMGKNGDVVLCPSCGRMLVLDEQLKTAIAK